MTARVSPCQELTVRKLLWGGQPGYTWSGHVVEADGAHLVLQAHFNAGRRDLGYVVFETGDIFIESYYYHHWFNIEQVYSPDGTLKGWYCNIATPPTIDDNELSFVDLAVDVFVYPDGRHVVLDQEEFEARAADTYPVEVAEAARSGLRELLDWVRTDRLPSRPPSIGSS